MSLTRILADCAQRGGADQARYAQFDDCHRDAGDFGDSVRIRRES